MRTVWGWLPRKPGPAGPAPETMPPEPGGTEDCMGPVLRGSPTGCCSWEDRERREGKERETPKRREKEEEIKEEGLK